MTDRYDRSDFRDKSSQKDRRYSPYNRRDEYGREDRQYRRHYGSHERSDSGYRGRSWSRSPPRYDRRHRSRSASLSYDSWRSRSRSISGRRNRYRKRSRSSGEEAEWIDRSGREKGASVRKIERQLEPKPTKIVALRNVPLDAKEDEIEATVRNTAISLGFSPPNFVKLLPKLAGRTAVTAGTKRSLAADREPNTTSAFVDFPSAEAAQVFVDACRRDFSLRGRKIRLELARAYVGTLSTMTAADAKLEWCQHVNRPGCPLCLQCRTPRLGDSPTIAPSGNTEELGPNLPYPDLSEFIIDRKSGFLFNEHLGLYFDPQTQQFISLSGIYYMKGTTSEPTLVPVFRLSTPGLGAQRLPQLPLDFPFSRNTSSGGAQTVAEPPEQLGVAEIDPTTSKASAVASVLAAAQHAARQTKRTKTKTAINDLEGTDADNTLTVSKRAITEHSTQIHTSVPNVQAVFNDSAFDEEDKKPSAGVKDKTIASSIANLDIQSAETGCIPPIIARIREDHVCFICLRRFETVQKLSAHELESQLHKKNAELQGMERAY